MSLPTGFLPTRQEIHRAISSFPKKQKAILLSLGLLFILSLTATIWQLNGRLLVDVAIPGGSLTEGIVGFPSHINPLLAVSDPDRDITTLIYSGLMRLDGKGNLIPDLAESFTISDDRLVYDFKLRPDLTWHDGAPLTVDDIIFTISKASDPLTKSPRRPAWEGVRTEKITDNEIRFTLKKPFPAFLDNTRMGILPKHLWENVITEAFILSDLNIKGIGSGPYKVVSVTRNGSGSPSLYNLEAFDNYALGTPKISTINLRFYENDENIKLAYQRGEIESFGSIPPETAATLTKNGAQIRQIPLPRSFAVFFNQNQGPLADLAVRQALEMATDKKALTSEVLLDAGVAIDHPIPPGSEGFLTDPLNKPDPVAALTHLEKAGWTKGDDGVMQKTSSNNKITRLEFDLATAATPELKNSALALAEQWKKIGAKVNVSVYSLSDLDQNLIRPRKFEALLFGEVLGREPDLYSFWHSSQRLAPGLNIAQYVSATTDDLLEKIRSEDDPEVRTELDEKFQRELAKDTPAIFLYSPYFLYAVPNKVKNASFPSLIVSAERFADIPNWYINSDRVWKIFTTDR